MSHRFIVVGGGTSGHINPAITIADALKNHYDSLNEECEIIFVGRKEGLEAELVPKAGYEMKYIVAKPFPMKPSPKMIKAFNALRLGRKQSHQIISEFKPDAVIGTGGYVCPPLLLEASKMKVPVILHEANAFPGRANKLVGNKAELVLTGFENLEKDFPKAKKIVFSGNPIRSKFKSVNAEKSREILGLNPDEKLVFAMGGSLGAQTINNELVKVASKFPDVKFVLGTGKQQSKNFDKANLPSNLQVMEYIDNPQDYLSAADISITRAGAVTCAEVAAIGSCSVFIPYPHAAHDHQTFNAKAFSDINGAILLPDSEVESKLEGVIKELLSDMQKRYQLRANAKKLAVYDCDERIVNAIEEVLVKYGKFNVKLIRNIMQ